MSDLLALKLHRPSLGGGLISCAKVSADTILAEVKEPGTVMQTSLSNEDEQALQQALDAARG